MIREVHAPHAEDPKAPTPEQAVPGQSVSEQAKTVVTPQPGTRARKARPRKGARPGGASGAGPVRVAQPFEGQIVGPAFTVCLAGDTSAVTKATFLDQGVPFAEVLDAPFSARRVTAPGTDGEHTLTIVLTGPDGSLSTLEPVTITVQRDLFANYARPADSGRAFLFPDGHTGIAVAQNDAYPWPDLFHLWRDEDAAKTEAYVAGLAEHGVNVMRIMLEYAQRPEEYLEQPIGTYTPSVVAFWDAFFPMCERYGITVLLTPWDTFWMSKEWGTNPYNAENGGPCATVHDFIVSPAAREAQKARIRFMVDRWGNSPAIFAWDILNEFDIWWDATEAERAEWIEDMAAFIQDVEMERWGHRHMLTVSSAKAEPSGIIGEIVYRHPRFDFANTHLYYPNANKPKDVVRPALEMAHGVRYALEQTPDGRPYTDSESGPIDRWPLKPAFDDLYHHHMAWAHVASGGTGTGMRWPYRWPHKPSDGMERNHRAIAHVSDDLDWTVFQPVNADDRLSANDKGLILIGCADEGQALLWIAQDVRKNVARRIESALVTLSGIAPGRYTARCWDTYSGELVAVRIVLVTENTLSIPLPALESDLAVTVHRLADGEMDEEMVSRTSDVKVIVPTSHA